MRFQVHSDTERGMFSIDTCAHIPFVAQHRQIFSIPIPSESVRLFNNYFVKLAPES